MDRAGFKAIFVWLRCHLILLTVIAFVVVGYVLRDELYDALAPIEVYVGYGLEGERGPVPVLPRPSQTLAQAPEKIAEPMGAEPNRVVPAEKPGAKPMSTAQTAPAPFASGRRQEVRDSAAPEVYQPQSLVSAGNYHFRPLHDTSDSGGASVFRDRQQELLNGARRAFWNDDLDTALELYRALVKEFPEYPEYLGELGNVYYKSGDKDLAAQAYLEAGVRFGKQGDRSRAERFRELLKDIDLGYAKALEEQLEGVTKPIATR